MREEVLALACRRFGLNGWQAREAHLLPTDVILSSADGFVRSLDRDELLRALGASVDALLAEREQAPSLARDLEDQLRALAEPNIWIRHAP